MNVCPIPLMHSVARQVHNWHKINSPAECPTFCKRGVHTTLACYFTAATKKQIISEETAFSQKLACSMGCQKQPPHCSHGLCRQRLSSCHKVKHRSSSESQPLNPGKHLAPDFAARFCNSAPTQQQCNPTSPSLQHRLQHPPSSPV